MVVNPFAKVKTDAPKTEAGKPEAPKKIDPLAVKEGKNPGLIQKNKTVDTSIPAYIQVLKIGSILLFVVSIIVMAYFKADLDKNNGLLSLVGYSENTFKKEKKLKDENTQLTTKQANLNSEKGQLAKKLEEKEYTLFTNQIETIRANQVVWFDRINEEGQIEIGLFNLPDHLGKYVNEDRHNQEDVPSGDQIEITNVTATRDSVNFGFEASNFYGRVFHLTNEFVRLINSFPTLEGVSVSSFSRSTNDDGVDSMSMSVNAKIQTSDSVDPFDNEKTYTDFQQWVTQQKRYELLSQQNASRPTTTSQPTSERPSPQPGVSR